MIFRSAAAAAHFRADYQCLSAGSSLTQSGIFFDCVREEFARDAGMKDNNGAR
jgi:hypothetical protein